jgi:hypothetical protein
MKIFLIGREIEFKKKIVAIFKICVLENKNLQLSLPGLSDWPV